MMRSIDQASGEMIFAGRKPQGWNAQWMRSPALMADSAAEALHQSEPSACEAEGLALLVSCIGRQLERGQRAVEKIEAAAEAMAARHALTGFDFRGQVSPHPRPGFSQRHGRTMTVATASETSDEA